MSGRYNLFEQDYWSSIVFYAIFFWGILWVVVILILAGYEYNRYRYTLARRKIEPIMAGIIQNVMLLEGDHLENTVQLREKGINVDNRYDFNAVRNLLKVYFQLLSDDYQMFIRKMFRENRLTKVSPKKLRSRFIRPKEILTLLNDLTLMRECIPEDVANRLLTSSRTQVLGAARKHLIRIKGADALPLIFCKIEKLSKLDAIELYETIKQHKIGSKVRFHHYLDISNDLNFNVLLLDLIVHFQEYDAKDKLLSLFEEGEEKLKNKVLNTMGKIMLYDVESYLIARYPTQSAVVQVEILKALGRLSLGSAKDFLISIFQDAILPLSFRKHALRSLYAIRKTSPGIIEQLESVSDGENLQLIRFIKHPLIKYI